jgi:hypothetical protein
MSEDRLEHNAIAYARALYANYILTMVAVGTWLLRTRYHKFLFLVPGVHISMALYGLSVFLETAQHLRKGRRRYIATNFTITMLVALSASIDVAQYFQVLLQSSSGRRLIQIVQSSEGEWERTLSTAAILLRDLHGVLVGGYFACYCLSGWHRFVLFVESRISLLIMGSSPLSIRNAFRHHAAFHKSKAQV